MAKGARGAENTDVDQLLAKWGISIDLELLVVALTHRSFANELGNLANNERLEFLGDSVLSIVATEELYKSHPDQPESDLTKLRSAVVSQTPLAAIARRLDLGSYLLLGVGENKTGGRDKDSILSDAVESLIGATYLTHGLEPTRKILLGHLRQALDEADNPAQVMDWKTPLRHLLRQRSLGELEFDIQGHGPDHDRHYDAQVVSDGNELGRGSGASRKSAENSAARDAYLQLTGGVPPGGAKVG